MFSNKFRIGIGIALLALAAAACNPIVGEGRLSVEPITGRETISVTGVGKARGNPDMATVTVGVNVANESISSAVSQSNETVDRITEALKNFGVEEEDIQTTNFSIWAEEQWDPATGQRREERLYRVESTLQVNLRQVDRMGELLQTAIENGANNIYGLSYGIQDSSMLANEARLAAVENARARAEQIAEATGLTLGEVVSVSETSGSLPMPFFESAMMGIGGGGDGGPPLSEGRMTVSVSVNVTYEIER